MLRFRSPSEADAQRRDCSSSSFSTQYLSLPILPSGEDISGNWSPTGIANQTRVFPALRPAIQQFGDEFFAHLQALRESKRKRKLQEAYQTHHQNGFRAAYDAYVQ